MIRQRHPDSTITTRRVEAFTDGVFSIAATLLVLDLTSRTLGTVTSNEQLWEALAGEWLSLANFALSFVLLSLLWMTHVSQFEHIARVDTAMLWLNSGRLLFVVLVPFSTALVTEYSAYFAGRMLLPITFFGAILLSWLQWSWALRSRETMMPDMEESEAIALGRGALSAVVICAFVVALSPWFGSTAFLIFFFDGLLTRLLRGRSA